MREHHPFRLVLADLGGSLDQRLELFAILSLGVIQSLAGGVLSPTEAVFRYFHVDNCMYAKKHLRNRDANAIMSHGTQLPDLFDALPPEEAQREFYRELEKIRGLCLRLLEKARVARGTDRAAA